MSRLGVLALTISLAGCGLAPTSLSVADRTRVLAQEGAEDLYPVAVGTSWTYATRSHAGNQDERPGADQRFQIVQSAVASGGVQAVMERWYGDRQMPSTQIARNAQQVVLSRYQHPEEGSLTVLRFPPTKGQSWSGRQWSQAAETIVCDGTASVTVPAGTYVATCTTHHIRYQDGREDQLHYWYASGVGMVKAIEGLTMDVGQGPTHYEVTAELRDFVPGAAR